MIIKPKWLARLKPLVQIIRDSSKEAKFVGGCVRDVILNKTVNDFDLATDARSEFFITALKKKWHKSYTNRFKAWHNYCLISANTS